MTPHPPRGGERPDPRVAGQCPLCGRSSERFDRIGVLLAGTVPKRNAEPASVLYCGDCGHRWQGPPVSELIDYATRGPVRLPEPPALEDEAEDPLDDLAPVPQDWEE
jgi:hypothetical protein